MGAKYLGSGAGCRRLLWLDLSGCYEMTDKAIAAIVSGCPDLQTLLLNELPRITDRTIATVVQGCPLLRRLE